MNSNNYDIEQMKKAWIEMGKVLRKDTPTSEPNNIDNMNTNLDKLRDRYRRGWEFSILGGIIFVIFLFWMPSLNNEYRLPIVISYAILMFSNGYVLYRLWRGLGEINPLSMSITQVSKLAKHYKKCHLLYYLIYFPVVIVWSGCFVFAAYRDEFGDFSIVIGFIIAAFCGIFGLWLYLHDYRNLLE